MLDREMLRQRIVRDTYRLDDLILRYASGDASVKQERDRLQGAIEVKLALLRMAESP